MIMKEYLNKIICADSLEIMKQLPDNSIDLVLTDPPYGINITKSQRLVKERWLDCSEWDKEIPPKEFFDEMIRISKNQIIWGWNYFLDYLWNTRCFLIWDKNNSGRDFADCEMAWTNVDAVARIHKERPQNMDWYKKLHPTQKPKQLFNWCLENYSEPWDIILDCFWGSWTTAVSCIEKWRQYIVIEKEPKYCEIAERRTRNTTLPLFTI